MQCKDTDIDIQESITRLQNCILEISNWMMVNSLKINGDKTEFIIFGNKPATYKNYSLNPGTPEYRNTYKKTFLVTYL